MSLTRNNPDLYAFGRRTHEKKFKNVEIATADKLFYSYENPLYTNITLLCQLMIIDKHHSYVSEQRMNENKSGKKSGDCANNLLINK